MIDLADAAARLRRPEHTGENRCRPCTVLNIGLAVAGALLVAELVSGRLGIVALGASLLLIYLRGYLVPGTPQITATYVPERVLRLFGKGDSNTDAFTTTDATIRPLLQAGVLTAARSDGRLRPTAGFRESWREGVAQSSSTPTEVADALGATDVTAKGEASFVVDGNRLVRWESKAALVADLATAGELRTRFDDWETMDDAERTDLLTTARAFLPACPSCDGPVAVERQRIDPCCRPPFTVVRSTCSECDTLLVETTVRDENANWLDALPVERGETP